MEKKYSFSERLREGLAVSNLKASDLSKLTGISKSSISHYLKGDWEGKQDAVYSISRALNVSEAWLMGYDVPISRDVPVTNDTRRATSLPSNILPIPKMTQKPLLGTIACGTPITATQNVDEMIDVPEHIQCDFVLRCKGDSMIDARIFDGDVVNIREQPDVENGEIAAVLIVGQGDSEATLKRVYKEPGQITLMPANSKYPPTVIVGEAANNVRILGRAVAFTSLIR